LGACDNGPIRPLEGKVEGVRPAHFSGLKAQDHAHRMGRHCDLAALKCGQQVLLGGGRTTGQTAPVDIDLIDDSHDRKHLLVVDECCFAEGRDEERGALWSFGRRLTGWATS